MEIPDLPPDLRFARMPRTQEAANFAFEAKRAAMGPHIIRHWAWDEEFQRDRHLRNFDEKPFFQIIHAEHPVGTLSFQMKEDHFRLGEFYLFPARQGKGLGSAILCHCLALADEEGLPTRLEHLHWNPVRTLYERHGFMEIGHSDIHRFMERPVPPRSS